VTDKITAEDAAELVRLLGKLNDEDLSSLRVLANLNTTGGSIKAAMQIGRMLRRTNSMAVVYHDANCLSSSVYILSGAIYRAVDGTVGIHRPYEIEARLISAAEQKKVYRELEIEIKGYLASGRLHSNIIEA
jgi:hypothetical protein